MAIPSVNLFSNLPGGGINAAMNANNALANAMHLRELNRVKAKYAPMTTQAEALSKLAYANLMGPQFLAKMMGNPDLVANLTEPQIKNNINTIQRAGMGQGTGAGLLNNLQGSVIPNAESSGNPLANIGQFIADKFKGIFPQSSTQQAVPTNSLMNPQPDMVTQAPQKPLLQSQQLPSVRPKGAVSIEGEQWYDKNGNPVYDEGIEDNGTPIKLEVTTGNRPKKEPSYAEKAARQRGIINQGSEAGKIRAASQKELDQDYQQALQIKQPFQKINEIITNPIFQKARQIPGFQKLQMNVKSKIGTPEEKKLIAEFQAAAQNVVAATVKGFGGRILASEIPLAQSMKLSDNDTIEAMIAKAPVIEEFNEMTLQRSKLASKLIEDEHLNKGAALEKADKMLDGEVIRKQVAQELKPKPTEEDYKYMMKKYGISKEEINKRLMAKGHL